MNEITPIPASTPATNEAIVGAPKDSAATAPVVEEAPIVEAPKRKIKWGDTEKEVSFDEAVQLAQKAFGIEAKAKEANEKATQADNILYMLQNDWKGFVKQCKANNIDPNKLATDILYEQIRVGNLTPEQKELEELKNAETERAAEQKEKEEAAKKVEIDQKTKEWSIKFENELAEALKTQGLPKTRLALALTAQYIDSGLQQKKEYTVQQVLPYVLRDLKEIHTSTMSKLEGDELLNYIGEELSNKISKARVARYNKNLNVPKPAVKKDEPKGNLPEDITKLKGKAYWSALRRIKSNEGVE